jgi:hypothetical protein
MRRGRQAKLRAGTLLPWTTPPFGYRLDPERPRDAAAVRVEPSEAVLVAQLFDWYLEPQATVYRLAKRLTDLHPPMVSLQWRPAHCAAVLLTPAIATIAFAAAPPTGQSISGVDRGAVGLGAAVPVVGVCLADGRPGEPERLARVS